MIWRRCARQERFFASSTSLLDLSLPAHDEALTDDTLTSIQLNFQWRKIIAAALENYFRHGDEGLALDNDDLFNNLLNDLYNAENIGVSFSPRVLQKNISADRSTTSSTFVIVPSSNVAFTPTKANFRVTCHGISMLNSSNDDSFVQVRFDGNEGGEQAIGRVSNTTAREVSCSAIFEGVSVGVEHDIALYFRRQANTNTISQRSELVFVIDEYDSP